MRPLRDVVRQHVAEHAATLAWRRRVGAEHAAAAERTEDEALTRYLRNAALLNAVFADGDAATSADALLCGSAAADAAEASALLAQLRERFGAQDAPDAGGSALAPDEALAAEAAAARARTAAAEQFSAATATASTFEQARIHACGHALYALHVACCADSTAVSPCVFCSWRLRWRRMSRRWVSALRCAPPAEPASPFVPITSRGGG